MTKLKKIELIDNVWTLDGRAVPEEFIKTGKATHQPNLSWTLDENFEWQPPTPKPDDEKGYIWDEETLQWTEVERQY